MKKVHYLFIALFVTSASLIGCHKEIKGNETATMKSAANNYITYSLDEVCLGDPVTITFNNGYNNNCGNIALQMSFNGGTWVQVAMAAPVNGVLSYTFTPSAVGDYLFRGRWQASGGPSCSSTGANIGWATATFPISVTDDCCEPGFTGEAISCDNTREAVYTFTSEDDLEYIKMQGGLTNFTGADAEVTVDGGNLVVSQWTPGGSSNRVIKLEGSVDACETVTVTIRWNSTNSGGVITGAWSVKDENGVELAPYLDGLICQ